MIESVQLCMAHGTFSTVEDDCPVDISPHEYLFATIDYDVEAEGQ